MRTFLFAVAIVGLSSSVLAKGDNYSTLVTKAKTAVSKDFKDPEGAKFRNIGIYKSKTGKGGVSVCGEVNAKNSYGAYTGYTPFVVSEDLVAIAESDGEGLYSVLGPALCHELVKSMK